MVTVEVPLLILYRPKRSGAENNSQAAHFCVQQTVNLM
jgi:hypothetical protein